MDQVLAGVEDQQQLPQPGPVADAGLERGGGVQRHPRLAHAADHGQRDQPRRLPSGGVGEQPLDLCHFRPAVDRPRPRCRQVPHPPLLTRLPVPPLRRHDD
ncbi:hypothetical protein [Streptomyces sp. NPDC102437]|uniref:hypothetical protein n=1 Tax=Streptomyces sp. NPDC102437 TaxID=3366175 RepID=UPI0037FF6D9F